MSVHRVRVRSACACVRVRIRKRLRVRCACTCSGPCAGRRAAQRCVRNVPAAGQQRVQRGPVNHGAPVRVDVPGHLEPSEGGVAGALGEGNAGGTCVLTRCIVASPFPGAVIALPPLPAFPRAASPPHVFQTLSSSSPLGCSAVCFLAFLGCVLPTPPTPRCPQLEGLRAVYPALGNLGEDMQNDTDLWQAWFDTERPEDVPCPAVFKSLTPFERLLLLRAMRQDRLLSALRTYVCDNMGKEYVTEEPFSMRGAFFESSPSMPIFFVLFPGMCGVRNPHPPPTPTPTPAHPTTPSPRPCRALYLPSPWLHDAFCTLRLGALILPAICVCARPRTWGGWRELHRVAGVDPTVWVEELGKELGNTLETGRFINISMGQGQEKPAEAALQRFAQSGGWVMLQVRDHPSFWTHTRGLPAVARTP